MSAVVKNVGGTCFSLVRRAFGQRRPAPRPERRRATPAVEPLEARDVPAAFDMRVFIVNFQGAQLIKDMIPLVQQNPSVLTTPILNDLQALSSDSGNNLVNNLAGDIDRLTFDLLKQAVQSPSNCFLSSSSVQQDVLYLDADLAFLPQPAPSGGGTAGVGNVSQAAQVAQTLQSRIWWESLGTFGGQSWGYVFIFGQQQVSGQPGWYSGTRVIYQGGLTRAESFAYQPTANGVVIDFGFEREQYTFSNTAIQVGTEDLAFQATGAFSDAGHWYSTRSSNTPADVRNLYYL
jgi:hypothetical protein